MNLIKKQTKLLTIIPGNIVDGLVSHAFTDHFSKRYRPNIVSLHIKYHTSSHDIIIVQPGP